MVKEKIDKLVKYITKKGITDFKIDENYHDYIDIPYSKDGISITIRLHTYGDYVRFDTPGVSPKYKDYGKWVTYHRKSTYNRRGGDVRRKVGGENINKLKVKFNRSDFYSTIYKNILLIQTWLDPVIEEKIKLREDLNQYTSELEFYFKDKYGNVILDISGDKTKQITAEVECKDGSTEYHSMIYENGGYFLNSIRKSWSWRGEKTVYKQRKKREKI